MPNDRFDALPRWEYATPGPLRERLNGLTLAGAKTTTFGLEIFETIDADPIPTPGQRWVMVGSDGADLAVVEVIAHDRMRLGEVTWELAEKEGESFVSVDDWREQHEAFWSQFLPEIRARLEDAQWSLDDDAAVTCTHLRVVERLSGHATVRFPVVECVVPAAEVEWVSSELIDTDATGIEELPGGEHTVATNGDRVPATSVILRAGFASDEAAVAAEAAIDRRWRPRFEVLLGDDWLDAWREHFEPQRVGRILVVPDWDGAPVDASYESDAAATILRMDPARSFGTGAHASTRLMIEALQQFDLSGRRVLDVGCGSGVLSIAALLLGATSAHGTDIEDAAREVMLQNATRNGVAHRCSTSREIPTSDIIVYTYHIVLANILAPVLIDLAPKLASALAPGGRLLLSGLIDVQVDRVVSAFPGLALVETLADGNWRCLCLESAET